MKNFLFLGKQNTSLIASTDTEMCDLSRCELIQWWCGAAKPFREDVVIELSGILMGHVLIGLNLVKQNLRLKCRSIFPVPLQAVRRLSQCHLYKSLHSLGKRLCFKSGNYFNYSLKSSHTCCELPCIKYCVHSSCHHESWSE